MRVLHLKQLNRTLPKLEDQINTISGIKQITSRSSEGLSMVIAEFNLDTSSAIAAQDVRDKLLQLLPNSAMKLIHRLYNATIHHLVQLCQSCLNRTA